ncbi:phage baseplate protein [Streptomyces vinaceus]|uniref:phage baseplate protein n=1 Tax=Streptomyces vinaceus TaxID=1960 RepID=UPI0036B0DA74
MPIGAIDTAQRPKEVLTRAYAQSLRTQMQSFAVDSARQQLYILQCIPNGVRLAPETAAVSFADRAAKGDLVCTRMSLQGEVLDWMYLRGFGHGSALGVVPRAGGGVDLWLEGLGRARGDYTEGQAVATTAYVPWNSATNTAVDCTDTTKTSTWAPSGVQQHYVPAVDALHRRIAVGSRAASGDASGYTYTYRLYDLDAAVRGDWTPLHTATCTQRYPQGIATSGDHLYLWTGRATDDDAVLTTLDWRTGKPVQTTRIRRLPGDDTYREPEGIAPWTPPGVGAAATRMCIGFAESHDDAQKGRSDRALTVRYLPGPAEPELTAEVLVPWTDIALAPGVTSGFSSRPPQARLIAIAGNRLLQLSGKIACSFSDGAAGGVIGSLPAALTPEFSLHAGCPRNARDGFAVCRVEANDDGTLYAYGATPANTIDWVQLDNFSVAWV